MSIREQARSLSPQKLSLPQWRIRHRIVLTSLVLPVSPLIWFVVRGPLALELATTYLLLVTLQAILAVAPRISPMVRQVFATGSLFTACAVLVAASGRAPAAHLVFAVVICVITLYQDVTTYVGGIVFLALYHLGLGVASPEFIYPESLRDDLAVSWSLTFFLVAVLTSFVGVLAWVLNSRGMKESEALKVALAEAGLRERQARDLNDSVVQHLVTIVYASEVGDSETAAQAARSGLAAARQLVASLLAPSWLRDRILLRDDPAQALPARSEDPETQSTPGERA
jgi:signal transduction histidine kinase